MPNIGRSARQAPEEQTGQSVVQNQQLSSAHVPLEVGCMVEVLSNTGVKVYGVIRWLGFLEGKGGEWAGVELVSDSTVWMQFCGDSGGQTEFLHLIVSGL